jgi:beta-lactamase regulating signal transducer with metallopeptidase domain
MENLITPFSHTLQYALGWMVVHSLWQAMVIALITGVLMLILRKKSAQVRYIVGNLALVAVFIAAVSTFYYYYSTETYARESVLSGLNIDKTKETTTASIPNNVITQNIIPDPQNEGKNLVITVAKEVKNDAFQSNTAIFKEYFNNNIPLIVTIWVLGMALFLLKLLSGISYTYIVRNRHNFPVDEYWVEKMEDLKTKLGIQKSIDLLESALVRSPVMVGHLKPVILFPIGVINRLNPQDVEAILAHEIAHIARHDYVFNILQSLVEALFYYHPAVWWLSTQVRNERESACDEIAIQLTGDSIHYAKTLVTVQEMAFFPLSTGLAFAGQPKKSQFLLRIQRILNQKQNPNVMEKLIATFLIVGSLVVLTIAQNNKATQYTQNEKNNTTLAEESFLQWGDAPLSMSGFWNAKIEGDEVKVTFNHDMERGNWTSTRRFKKSEFSAMPTTESEFTLSRQAGTMKFKGKFEDNEGYGKFKFEENTDFKTYLASEGINDVKKDIMVHLFMSNINKDYMVYLRQNGYTSISKSQLQSLAIHGLTKESLESYFKNFNSLSPSGKLDLDNIVQLKIHGVDVKYRQDLLAAGYIDVPLDAVLQAKIHGIDADYMREMSGQKLNLEDLIQMKIHGVDVDFINKMSKGKNGLSPDEIVTAKIHGVDKIDVEKLKKAGVEPTADDLSAFAIHGIDADFIEKMNNAGFGKLDAEELLSAKIHGVTPETVKIFNEMGFKNMSLERVVEFKIHGVTPEYAKELANAGYKDLSASRLVEFKIHGITSEYVKSVADMGFRDLSASKLVEMKIHNVKADFIKGFNEIGYKDIPVNKIIELKIHGVKVETIKELNTMGFKEIPLSKVIETKIHGITPDYIKRMQEKGYKNLDLNEYINLKIQGFGSSNGGSRNFNTTVKPNIKLGDIKVDLSKMDINLGDLKIDIDEGAIEKVVSEAISGSPVGGFLKLLVKDNHVKLNKQVVVKGNRNWLSVDGKKLDDAVFQQYKKQVEAKEGEVLSKEFRFGFEGKVLDLKGDKITTKGSFETDDN